MTQTATSIAPTELEKHKEVLGKLIELYGELFSHDGYGDIRLEMKILRRGQKEIIIHCGKQHRFVLDCDQALVGESAFKHLLKRDLLS
ncbi:hypothetical protein [Neptunomonas japonica]|uniref:hypothetical protein n=1 Tax=Neptunomonas japonica TaxID=417574 RepID=UPI000415B704|nr:hypothetical protein [Neptunomonas japonica]